MSYKLINANNITFNSDGFITAKNIEKMPCIYADLPNGMDGEHYVLEQEPTEWQIDHAILKAYSDGADDVLDKIRDEVKALSNANPSYWHSGDMVERVDVLEIIDNYRESEDTEKLKPCINYEDGCEEWNGCPCVYYKAESEVKA